jgi:mono/diheme cytochrome c family protein
MHRRTRRTLILLAVGLAAAACASSPSQPPAVREEVVLPVGDPTAGRAAFIALSCTSCHGVLGDPDLPPVVSANPGPMLGPLQAERQLGWIVTSIVSPTHEIPPEVRLELEGTESPMPDYSYAMTVRQLIDLVAYLRHQG